MLKTDFAYCQPCGTTVPVKVRRTNHILHAVLSLVTFGVWLPVWIIAAVNAADPFKKPKCPRCKHKVT